MKKNVPLIEWTCPDCSLIVKKCDTNQFHTDVICLQKQLENLRQSSQKKIRQLEDNVLKCKDEVHTLRINCAEHIRN